MTGYFLSAKLPRRLPPLYDPEVSNGYILVGVQRPAGGLTAGMTTARECTTCLVHLNRG